MQKVVGIGAKLIVCTKVAYTFRLHLAYVQCRFVAIETQFDAANLSVVFVDGWNISWDNVIPNRYVHHQLTVCDHNVGIGKQHIAHRTL